MKKQFKLAAVASAAALLAIGASMTAFAASGWVEEDGVWYYYDSDGNRVEDEWRKSGDNWYWLDSDENGAMATDKLVYDDDNTYYVDSNGVMVTNTWVMTVNEDQDDDEDPAEYNYYYMQSNGRAYKQSGDTVQKKTINGKTYAFDEDGKMLYGWVQKDGVMLNGQDDWQTTEDVYYFGSWEDGSMKTGWQKIYVHDQDKDDDYSYWFNFKSNGIRRTHKEDEPAKTWKSGGKYYHFNQFGVMVYEWYVASNDETSANVGDWRYFNSPEDGARMTKGWFKVVPPTGDNTFTEDDTITFASSDSDDESERWYYADGDGILACGEIKKIKGKYYGFWPDNGEKGGRMLTGLCALKMDKNEGSIIEEVLYNDMDSDDLDDFMDYVDGKNDKGEDGKGAVLTSSGEGIYLYYFGSDDDQDTDGSMKTGTVNLSLDGDSYTFNFSKSGGTESRGRSVSGIDDDYIYKFGQRIKADSDDKYILVSVIDDNSADGAIVNDYSGSDIRSGALKNFESTTTEYYKGSGENKSLEETIRVYDFREYTPAENEVLYLVNTSGKIQTSKKTGVKDGDDWYWYITKGKNGNNVVAYANSKNFAKSELGLNWADGSTGNYGTTTDTETDTDTEPGTGEEGKD